MTRRFTMLATPFTRSALTRLRKSWGYDVAMRLPMLAWTVFLALVLMAELEQYCHTAGPGLRNASYALNIAMRLSMITYLVILTAMLLIRSPPKARARGVEPRVSAWLGTFLITAGVLFPRHDLSPAASCVSSKHPAKAAG